jgi:mxaK protein
MKRISVHAVFAIVALGATAVCVMQAVRLQRLNALNTAIATATQAPVETEATTGAPAAPRDAPPEVRLARATALSKAGAFDAAFKGYSGLIEPGAPDGVGRHALFNLGNMYLRQGLGASRGDASAKAVTSAESAPLIELAKQRYRDLLRADPGDWDARYNLERALRLAPEEQEAVTEDANTNIERRNVMLRGMDPGDLP